MSLVSLPPQIELFAGPLTTIGATAYDTLQLVQAAAWVADATSDKFFYDTALANYMLYYRTGDTQWLTRAEALATELADFASNPVNQDGSGRSAMAPRDYGTLGMAILYLRTGYANALAAVRSQAAGGLFYFSPFTVPSSRDARESAYALIAMLATTVLGGDPNNYSTGMATAINAYLDRQGVDESDAQDQANDGWQAVASLMPGDGCYIINYMQGLVMEAMILYDRVIGDSRIVPSVQRAVDWLWATHWQPLGGGPGSTKGTSTTSVTIGTGTKVFTTQAGLTIPVGQAMHIYRTADNTVGMVGTTDSYSSTTLTVTVTRANGSGTFTDWQVEQAAYPGDQTTTGVGTFQYGHPISDSVHHRSNRDYTCLMGMLVPAFGYLHMKGQGTVNKTNGDAILAAIPQGIFYTTKQFGEAFRSSPRYLGYVATSIDVLTAPRGAAALMGAL
jgi:hypothetical protein